MNGKVGEEKKKKKTFPRDPKEVPGNRHQEVPDGPQGGPQDIPRRLAEAPGGL